MTNRELLESLRIFSRYVKDDERTGLVPEHDTLYYNLDSEIEPDDVAKLAEMGWEQEDGDFNEEGYWIPESYNPGCNWSIRI